MCYYSHSQMLSSSKLKPTPAQCLLKNYLHHPKTSYFPAIQSGMRLTFRGAPDGMGQIITGAKKQKKVLKSLKGNIMVTITASLMVQICFSSITSSIF